MCECCAQHAANQQGHLHVGRVNGDDSFKNLKTALADVPGVVGVEFIQEAGQAKIVFDKRIVELASLTEILGRNGFAVS